MELLIGFVKDFDIAIKVALVPLATGGRKKKGIFWPPLDF